MGARMTVSSLGAWRRRPVSQPDLAPERGIAELARRSPYLPSSLAL